MQRDEKEQESAKRQQLLVEYDIVQRIADRETHTIYLTFAVFFPVSVTAAASLLALLISERIEQTKQILLLGVLGALLSSLLVWLWWRVADRRRRVRRKMFERQAEIEEELGSRMKISRIFREQLESYRLVPLIPWIPLISRLHGDATFVNLMRVVVLVSVLAWAAVVAIGALRVSQG